MDEGGAEPVGQDGAIGGKTADGRCEPVALAAGDVHHEAEGRDVRVLPGIAAEEAGQQVRRAQQQQRHARQALRSTFGAVQNRFQSVITNLATTSENLSASRSRIMDADFAKETAELTRAQILQQAGTAMLAQANAAPQNVLSLLR